MEEGSRYLPPERQLSERNESWQRPYGLEDEPSDAEEIEEVLSLQDTEKELIRKALEKHNNRRKNAAEELGISERTLYRKIKEYGLK